jgi:hypothetical protein
MSDSSENVQHNDTKPAVSSEGTRRPARRWYHPRPQPRCASDLVGFNWTYWLFIAFLAILIFIP